MMYFYLTAAILGLILALYVARTMPEIKARALWYEDSPNRPHSDPIRAVKDARENWALYRQSKWLVATCLAYSALCFGLVYFIS